jgi:hypothetical protein
MGSGVVIHIVVPSFRKIGSGIQKLIKGIHRHTNSKVIFSKYVKQTKNV